MRICLSLQANGVFVGSQQMINSIISLIPRPDWKLQVTFSNGIEGLFDVGPYLNDEAFEDLKDIVEL